MDESSQSRAMRFEVFICHASEDKNDFVRPLATELARLGLSVWYDEWTLALGDSLRKTISKGFAESNYGVVVLSHHFFKEKLWTEAELSALFNREVYGRKVILPIWHNVTQEDVLRYSPLIADRLAASSDKGIEAVSLQIFNVIRASVPEASTPVIKSNSSAPKQGSPNLAHPRRPVIEALAIIIGFLVIFIAGVIYLQTPGKSSQDQAPPASSPATQATAPTKTQESSSTSPQLKNSFPLPQATQPVLTVKPESPNLVSLQKDDGKVSEGASISSLSSLQEQHPPSISEDKAKTDTNSYPTESTSYIYPATGNTAKTPSEDLLQLKASVPSGPHTVVVPGKVRNYTLDDRVRYQLWNYTWKPVENRPITRIVVRLKEQKIYVYQDEHEAANSPVSTGMKGHETPLGHYEIMEKNIDYKSKFDGAILDANGSMVNDHAKAGQEPPAGDVLSMNDLPYYLRFSKDTKDADGMGFHAGFLPGFPATNDGSIRLPHAFAELLFSNVSVDTPIDIVP